MDSSTVMKVEGRQRQRRSIAEKRRIVELLKQHTKKLAVRSIPPCSALLKLLENMATSLGLLRDSSSIASKSRIDAVHQLAGIIKVENMSEPQPARFNNSS